MVSADKPLVFREATCLVAFRNTCGFSAGGGGGALLGLQREARRLERPLNSTPVDVVAATVTGVEPAVLLPELGEVYEALGNQLLRLGVVDLNILVVGAPVHTAGHLKCEDLAAELHACVVHRQGDEGVAIKFVLVCLLVILGSSIMGERIGGGSFRRRVDECADALSQGGAHNVLLWLLLPRPVWVCTGADGLVAVQ